MQLHHTTHHTFCAIHKHKYMFHSNVSTLGPKLAKNYYTDFLFKFAQQAVLKAKIDAQEVYERFKKSIPILAKNAILCLKC